MPARVNKRKEVSDSGPPGGARTSKPVVQPNKPLLKPDRPVRQRTQVDYNEDHMQQVAEEAAAAAAAMPLKGGSRASQAETPGACRVTREIPTPVRKEERHSVGRVCWC